MMFARYLKFLIEHILSEIQGTLMLWLPFRNSVFCH